MKKITILILLLFFFLISIGCKENTCQNEKKEEAKEAKKITVNLNESGNPLFSSFKKAPSICDSTMQTGPNGNISKNEFRIDWASVYCDYIAINLNSEINYYDMTQKIDIRIYHYEKNGVKITQYNMEYKNP